MWLVCAPPFTSTTCSAQGKLQSSEDPKEGLMPLCGILWKTAFLSWFSWPVFFHRFFFFLFKGMTHHFDPYWLFPVNPRVLNSREAVQGWRGEYEDRNLPRVLMGFFSSPLGWQDRGVISNCCWFKLLIWFPFAVASCLEIMYLYPCSNLFSISIGCERALA